MADYLYSQYEQSIWAGLFEIFSNAYAVAGIMGWMYGESYLIPFTAEQDSPPCNASATITRRFDQLGVNERGEFSGDYDGRWIDDSIYDRYWRVNGRRYGGGYGLAQWTETQINSRKHAMFEYYKGKRRAGRQYSVGSVKFQLEWLDYEMQKYFSSLYRRLKTVTSVERAMYIYGLYYEVGGDVAWTESIVARRITTGIRLYNKYSGSTPVDPPDPGIPIPPDPDPWQPPIQPDPSEPDTHTMPLWMMINYD